MYEAFTRGDIPAILDKLDTSVEWEAGGTATDVPWLQARSGREGAAQFFSELAALDFHTFRVRDVVELGSNRVIAVCDVEATVRATGKRFVEPDELHLWVFNEGGLATSFKHRLDTHLQWKAFHGNE